jgi:hypothetical protein
MSPSPDIAHVLIELVGIQNNCVVDAHLEHHDYPIVKANRVTVNFADEPVTLGDMFGLLEKLGGPAGWQLAQKLGGY